MWNLILGIAIGIVITQVGVLIWMYGKYRARKVHVIKAGDILRQRENWNATAELHYQSGEMKEAVQALVKSDRLVTQYHEYVRKHLWAAKDRKAK
jgi:hypothetical protein